MSTDRIEKQILLRAPRGRIWRALTDSSEFGSWFGFHFDDPFTPGAVMRGSIVGTTVNAEVAEMQRSYAGHPVEIRIEQMVPETLFSFRWHPFALEQDVDYSGEPTTLIEFTLHDVPEGVLLRVTESGFEGIPLVRRAKAFQANEQGWGLVITLIEAYLAQHA